MKTTPGSKTRRVNSEGRFPDLLSPRYGVLDCHEDPVRIVRCQEAIGQKKYAIRETSSSTYSTAT